MPILIILLTAFVGAAIWYFRLRGPEAVDDVVGAAGNVRGAYRRKKFREKVESATLTGIDDPGLAAAVLHVSLAEAGRGLDARQEDALREWLADVVGYRDPAEAVTYAKWVVREVVDANEVVRRLTPLWRARLAPGERHELIAAAERIAGMGGSLEPAQRDALRRLETALNA